MSPNGNIQVTIDGDIHDQVAVGNNIIQIGDVNGGFVYVAPQVTGPKYTRRESPVNFRPRPFPSLLDREDETATVISALQDSTPVSLFSPGGIGKTSLLRSLAHSSEASVFFDGVVYRRVARLGLEDVLQSLFDAFYKSRSNFKPTDSEIRVALQGINALILLDDLSITRDESMTLLDAAPGCVFVLASKERNLWGEGRIVSLEGLPDAEASNLFVHELNRSLNDQEQAEVREICKLLNGHPLQILQSASLAREKYASISDIKAQLRQDTPDKVVLNASLKSSTDKQKSLVAILAAAGGVAVPVEHLRSLSQSDTVTRDLQGLASLGLVEADGSKFNLVGELAEAVSKLWDLTSWENRLIVFLADWLIKKPAKKLLDESIDVLLQSLQKAGEKNRWSDVVRIGRGLESTLILLRRWQTWLNILNMILKAARALGDRKIEAWALHQLGTRAACLGFGELAREFLTQALQIRQAIGDQAGLAITQNNMHVFFKIPLPPKPGQTKSGCRRWLTCGAVTVLAGVVVVGAIVVAAQFWNSSEPEPILPPTQEKIAAESATPIPPADTKALTKTPSLVPPSRSITVTKTNTPTRTPTRTLTPTITPSPTKTQNSPPPAPEIDYPKETDTVICPSGSDKVIMKWIEPNDPSGIDNYEVSLGVEVQPGVWQLLINHKFVSATQLDVTNEISGRCGETFEFFVRAWDNGGAMGKSSSIEFFVFFPGPD